MRSFKALAEAMMQPLEISVREDAEGRLGRPMFVAALPSSFVDANWELLSTTLWYDSHRSLGPSLYWSQFKILMGKS